MSRTRYVTHADLVRLERWEAHAPAQALDAEAVESLRSDLAQAIPVTPADVPPDVVTLDTTFQLRDATSGQTKALTVVGPGEADPAAGRISVLAPLGLAVLGRRAGEDFEWRAPAGLRRVRIERVVHQPEAARRAEPRHAGPSTSSAG